MNYGVLTRITTVITGMIIIIVLPLVLSDTELQNFFIMYSFLPVVALIDFGLSTRILATQSIESLSQTTILSMILLRCCLLIAITASFFIYFNILSYEILLILEIAIISFYLSILCNSVIEAFDSFEKSYKLKFFSELILVLTLTLLCILRIADAWFYILSILMVRSCYILFYFIIKIRNILSRKALDSQVLDQNLKIFTFQVGVVSALGYLSGQATNWIVALNFSVDESLSYSQCFYIISTIHSLVMSYLIYFQVTFKTDGRVYDTYIKVRNKYFLILTINFVIGGITTLCIMQIINNFINIIKFDSITFFLLLFYFIPIIYNHLTAIVYRINGIEILFYLSILGSITIVGTFNILGNFYDLPFVLFVNAVLSIVCNFALTKLIVNRRGYNV